ncbi:MAG: ribonuclease HI family protein [Nitrosopumilales archaeon]|nr:MAG: ribonuclease HI family protein [Nitrosopumilales archaeon]
MKVYKCYFDGSCEPQNPGGTMGVGVFITSEDQEFRKSEHHQAKSENTNNIAEYLAFQMVLKLMQKKSDCLIKIYGDSKLVVMQMTGQWKIKEGAYVPYAREAKLLLEDLRKNNSIIINWIPREENREADNQSKAHLKQ